MEYNIMKDFREIGSENVGRTILTQDRTQWLTDLLSFTILLPEENYIAKRICGSRCRSRDYVECKNEEDIFLIK
jgi:hypothetical protein